MDKFIKDLGITYSGSFENNDSYVIDLVDSNEYSKVYSILDKSDKVELDTETILVSDKLSEIIFRDDKYEVKLLANFVDNVYKVVVSEEN